MTVRLAKPKDAAALAALHATSFDPPWPASDFETHIARDLVLVCSNFQSLLVIRDVMGQAEILTLATHPDARGQGLAKALLNAALPRLTADVLFLEVAEDNAPALALYRNLGFQAFGRRPAYYRREQGRVAAITMELRLNHSRKETAPSPVEPTPPAS